MKSNFHESIFSVRQTFANTIQLRVAEKVTKTSPSCFPRKRCCIYCRLQICGGLTKEIDFKKFYRIFQHTYPFPPALGGVRVIFLDMLHGALNFPENFFTVHDQFWMIFDRKSYCNPFTESSFFLLFLTKLHEVIPYKRITVTYNLFLETLGLEVASAYTA